LEHARRPCEGMLRMPLSSYAFHNEDWLAGDGLHGESCEFELVGGFFKPGQW